MGYAYKLVVCECHPIPVPGPVTGGFVQVALKNGNGFVPPSGDERQFGGSVSMCGEGRDGLLVLSANPTLGKVWPPDTFNAVMVANDTRFDGILRLYGSDGMRRLRGAHICIVGVGGVGSWAVEALARSGVGALTLVDLDEVCVSNINRQIHALDSTVGRSKVEVMAARVLAINPECRVTVQSQFFSEATAGSLLAPGFNYVLDAIDGVTNKTLLLACCVERKIPVVSCGGAGGRRDGASVRVADLARVTHDRLLAEVRKRLRKHHNFPSDDRPMGVDCVFSPESPVFAQDDGSLCAARPAAEEGTRLNCNGGLGSATFVTGTFGFVAAGLVVGRLAAP